MNCNRTLYRHIVVLVCRAAQENGVRTNGVSTLTGTAKSRFSYICSSMMSYPNGTKFIVELASMQERLHSKFEQDPSSRSCNMSQQVFVKISTSSFHTLCYNSCMHAHLAEI